MLNTQTHFGLAGFISIGIGVGINLGAGYGFITAEFGMAFIGLLYLIARS